MSAELFHSLGRYRKAWQCLKPTLSPLRIIAYVDCIRLNRTARGRRRLASGPDALRCTTSASGHSWKKATTIAHANKTFNDRIGVGGGRGLAVWDDNSNGPGGRVLGIRIGRPS
jgi:hypothetical protein